MTKKKNKEQPRDTAPLRALAPFQNATTDDLIPISQFLDDRIAAENFDPVPPEYPLAHELERLINAYFHGLYYDREGTLAFVRKFPIEDTALRLASETLTEFRDNMTKITDATSQRRDAPSDPPKDSDRER